MPKLKKKSYGQKQRADQQKKRQLRNVRDKTSFIIAINLFLVATQFYSWQELNLVVLILNGAWCPVLQDTGLYQYITRLL